MKNYNNKEVNHKIGIYCRQYQRGDPGIPSSPERCDRLPGSATECIPFRTAERWFCKENLRVHYQESCG